MTVASLRSTLPTWDKVYCERNEFNLGIMDERSCRNQFFLSLPCERANEGRKGMGRENREGRGRGRERDEEKSV